ncbi:MAG: 2-C-methyl-D-erythritol 4-phosphate cytidylyltransferase [Acidimicrobiia bacterium]
MQTWAIVVAAGSGARFGGAKQFRDVGGVRLVDRAVRTATRCCDGVVVVLPAGTTWDGPAVAAVVLGGSTRAESVRAGLAAVPDTAEVVVVHDAARPLAGDALFGLVIDAIGEGVDGAVPGLAVSDTIKRVDRGRVVATVARDDLVSVQTPQAFRATALRAAHAEGAEGTDDAALVEAAGGTVVVVAGEPTNVKVTGPEDLMLVDALLSLRSGS